MFDFFVSTAHAMAPPAGGQAGQAGGNPLMGLMPIVIMFAVFYFLIIMPQQKKAKKHKAMIEAIKKGDKVLTAGGIEGIVVGTAETTVTVEIAEGVKVKVSRGYITGVNSETTEKPA